MECTGRKHIEVVRGSDLWCNRIVADGSVKKNDELDEGIGGTKRYG